MTTVKIIRQGKAAKKFKAADLFNNHFEEEEKLKAESEEDKMMYNKTSQIKQISLFVLPFPLSSFYP